MKRTLAVFLMILLLLPLYPAMAQDASIPANSPIRLGGKGDDSIGKGSMLALSNGNLLLSISTHRGRNGQGETKRSNAWTWLLCLAPDGSILWETEFGEDRGSMGFGSLTEQPNETVAGYVHYSIEQHSQYMQKRIYSLKDGSLVWKGEPEKTTDDSIYVSINTAGSRYLREETHDAQAKCEPRFYQLEEADGKVAWRVDAESIGLNNLRGVLPVPQGTLLYGCLWEDGATGGTAKALVMDDQGKVLWSLPMKDLGDADLLSALNDSGNHALLSGFNYGPFDSKSGHFEYRKKFVLQLDTTTGQEIWRKEYPDGAQTTSPTGLQLTTEQGYLSAAIDTRDYSGFVYQLLGTDGTEQAPWQVTLKDTAIVGLNVFHWNGEIWQLYTAEQDGDMDVVLERLIIPDAAKDS